MSRARGREGRNAWLASLAYLVDADGADGAARALHDAIVDAMVADGTDPLKASEIALRSVKLGAHLIKGREQRTIASVLGCSERTAKRDARRLREALQASPFQRPSRLEWPLNRGASG